MIVGLNSNSAAQWLTWSNRIYVSGAVLTLASAAMVLYDKRSKNQGRALRWGLLTEIVVIVAAFISLCGTVGAITFGNIVSHFKDVDLDAYRKSADLKIVQANKDSEQAKADAAIANQKAQEAHDKAVIVEGENLKLGGKVGADAAMARNAEAALEAKNKETNDFAHSLALQQQGMAEQAKVSPVLNQAQVLALANVLRPFAGQSVPVHMTLDTVVIRLGNGIEAALQQAGLKPSGSMDAGQTYQGVSVVVHSPQDVPQLANALVMGLRQAGIEVQPVSLPSVPQGEVAVYLGPR